MRRRITDAFAWLSARPPAGGPAGVRDGNGGRPGSPGWDETSWGQNGSAAMAAGGTAASSTMAGGATATAGDVPAGAQAWGHAPYPPNGNDGPSGSRPQGNKNKALIAGASVLAVAAVAGVIVAPKLLGSSDPGCKSYSGATLAAYNKTIGDLNAQSSQRQLTQDMTTTIADLKNSIAQTQGDSVKSALNGLLTELKSVQSDITSGSVPSATVSALNTASTAADRACLPWAC
ncbi:MAG TPA: hypothetical protein VGM12_22505 [Trebonia sp.]